MFETYEDYLASLPPERQQKIKTMTEKLRMKLISQNVRNTQKQKTTLPRTPAKTPS